MNFCDKNLSTESPKICNICNVTLHTSHCQQGHKLLCCGKGSFGWKCLKCKKFSYRFGNLNSKLMESMHQCGTKKCIYCCQDMDLEHLCKLKLEKYPKAWPFIAFIGIEHVNISVNDCLYCLKLKNEAKNGGDLASQTLSSNSEYLDIACVKHKNNEKLIEPAIIVIYKEVKRGIFRKYVLTSADMFTTDFIEENVIDFAYLSKELSSIYDNAKSVKRPQKKTFDFDQNFKILQAQNTLKLSVINKFVQLTSQPEWQNTTFILQDYYSQNYNTILSAYIKNGFCPKVIQNGRKIIFMEVQNFNLRFITSNSYLEGFEFDLAKQYNLNLEPYFFPENLKNPLYFHYNEKVPNIEHFYLFNDNNDIKEQKENFVKNLNETNYVWNFQKELLRYCDEKVWCLTIACLKFLEESFNFQVLIKKENQIQGKELLHPFGYELCSMPGFTFKLYKILYLNYEEMYIVKNEYGFNNKNVSKLEFEWATYMEYKYPHSDFLSAFNNPLGQQYFKEAIPDLYSPLTKEAHFFNGCKWHGHLNGCLLFPNATNESLNPVGIDYKTLNEKFLLKASNLLLNNPDKVEKVTIHWECLYLEKRKTFEMKLFLKNIFKPHPLKRLCPRSCVRGSYSDVYALKWSENMFPDEEFHFYDVNGLYSYAAIKFPYFTSKYKVLIGKELRNIIFKNGRFFYNTTQIYGTMLVTILPPKKLFLPCLTFKTSNGKSFNTLCSKCCQL